MLQHGQLIERMRRFQERYEFMLCAVNQLPPFEATLDWPKEIDGVAMEHYVAWMKSAYWITATLRARDFRAGRLHARRLAGRASRSSAATATTRRAADRATRSSRRRGSESADPRCERARFGSFLQPRQGEELEISARRDSSAVSIRTVPASVGCAARVHGLVRQQRAVRQTNASFSADGQWIAFTSQRSGPSKMFRVHADGSSLEQITDGDAFDDSAAFSPDAKSIAFVSTRDGQADVWSSQLGDARLAESARSTLGEFRPSWSADGEIDRVLYGPRSHGRPMLPGQFCRPRRCRRSCACRARVSTSCILMAPVCGASATRSALPGRRAGPGAGPRCCSTTLPSKTRAAQALFATALKLLKFSRSTSERGRA